MTNTDEKIKINFVPLDYRACGRYRIIYPAQVLYNAAKVTISAPATFYYYGQDWIYTQRVIHKDVFEPLLEMKQKFNVKFIIDYDDKVWDELPGYNKCGIDVKEARESMKKYLPLLADKVTCTNEIIKKALTEFIPEDRIIVMPNCLDYHRWRFDPYPVPAKDSFIFAGSPTHWAPDDLGDFSKGLVTYLNNKDVNVMGHAPTFLPNAKTVGKWVDIDDYPIYFAKNALPNKFIIAPLADNDFNKCKSDLKYIESCAIGRVCLVSEFPGCSYNDVSHPYQRIPINSTATAIKYIVERATEHYGDILTHQYAILSGRWLDWRKYLELFK